MIPHLHQGKDSSTITSFTNYAHNVELEKVSHHHIYHNYTFIHCYQGVNLQNLSCSLWFCSLLIAFDVIV